MNKDNTGLDQTDADILVAEIADEALEAAACAGREDARAFTIAMCTGQAECPF
jgi:hypothetical protein